MDSIAVFDDNKRCFRKLNKSNYNDDLVVGTVFFSREAINVIEKYYRIIGYMIYDEKGASYPIDIRNDDIAMLEGTYNCMTDKLKIELTPYNLQTEPPSIWSSFFFRWQFMCDWDAFDNSGSFIKLSSQIIGNESLMRKITSKKINFVFPTNYKELSQMVCGLNQILDITFYNKDYYEEINYLFDSLLNGYHINMSREEVDTYCYQICNYVLEKVDVENV